MKKYILYIIILTGIAAACDKVPVGYLDAANGEYTPDSLVIKSVLNPDDPDDAKRIEFQIPWQSNPIQGVAGTPQLRFSVTLVTDENGNTFADALSQIYLVGAKARITVGYDHTIPAVRYKLSLKASNEDHEQDYPEIFTLIVE